ncbi:MAG: LacI family transcriptional regulator [Planctomycetota bacterium]|nr:MAG: LacI family transcriptional regulator [Planctomycetota bacterium]
MRKKVTIEDISRLTGLSRGTISRALNNRPDISEATRQKVLAACRKLHYTPSFAARSLATGRQLAVLVLVPAADVPVLPPFVAALSRYAGQQQYVTLVSVLASQKRDLPVSIAELPAERADAAIVLGSVPKPAQSALRRRLGTMPCVLCDESEGLSGDVIAPDTAEAGRLAVRALPRQVRRFLCLVAGDPRQRRFAEGVREQAARRQVEVEVAEAAEGLEDRLAGVDAVVCGDDVLAAFAMGWLRAAGRAVGEEVWVIGHGNTALCEQLPVPLTSIEPEWDQVARRAFDTARARIEKLRRDAPSRVLVPPRLIVRSSCPAGSDL